MIIKNKPTTNEHFIPQCYLKQFSQDNKHIYQIDMSDEKLTQKRVSTESICYEKNLYEFKNESGDFMQRNLIEKSLSVFEADYINILRSIQSKAAHEENFHTLCFLSKNEKKSLVFFLSTMVLRKPENIKAAQETTMEVLGDLVTETTARNWALQYCLPITKEIKLGEKNLLNSFCSLFDNMAFQIGIADKDQLLTSDVPVILFEGDKPNKIHSAIFTLSPQLVLYMKKYETTKKELRNRLVYLEISDIEFINNSIIKRSNRWIYSKYPLSKNKINQIVKLRKDINI